MSNYSRIYCDMDGVLCDFEKNIKNTLGISVQKWMSINPKHERWQPIVAKKDFWSNMPWLNDGKNLWRFIEKYNHKKSPTQSAGLKIGNDLLSRKNQYHQRNRT